MAVKVRADQGRYGWIKMEDTKPMSTTSILVQFLFKVKHGHLKSDSIYLYYTDNPGNDSATKVIITKENAKSWKEYTKGKDGGPPGSVRVKYIVTDLTYNTTYYFRSWMKIYGTSKTGDEIEKQAYASPSLYPTPETTQSYHKSHPLFQIAQPVAAAQGSTKKKCKWIDFTQFIEVPSYDVNMVDVTEDWTDANYTTHRIVPTSKIQGKFNMRFTTPQDYNKFMWLLAENEEAYGDGYCYLRVQVNNLIDTTIPDEGEDDPNFLDTVCERRMGDFFLKFESNPWAEPYYGHLDKYSAITVSIQQA